MQILLKPGRCECSLTSSRPSTQREAVSTDETHHYVVRLRGARWSAPGGAFANKRVGAASGRSPDGDAILGYGHGLGLQRRWPEQRPRGPEWRYGHLRGQFHNLALKDDGTVVAWGYNQYGQSDVPAGFSGVKVISAGGYHNLALVVENIPPTLSVSHTPDGTNGWNKTSQVTLNVSASDSGSGLAATPTCTDGPTALTLTASPTAAGNWTSSVSRDGTHNISCSVSDKATNKTTKTDTVNIDANAPTISNLGPTTSATNGWYKTDVTNAFRATDSGSGLNDACITAFQANQAGDNVQSKTTTGEGTALKVTSDGCTDVAGNTSQGIDSANFKVDKTKPLISRDGVKSGTLGTNNWYTTDVGYGFTAADPNGANGSGLALADQAFTRTTSGQGAAIHVSSGTVADLAGNVADAIDSPDFMIDNTAPTVISTFPGSNGTMGKADLVTATFSEQMDASTVNTTTFYLKKYTIDRRGKETYVPVTAKVTTPSDSSVAVLNPTKDLTTGSYQATITKGVTDKAGNALVSPKTWSFKVTR